LLVVFYLLSAHSQPIMANHSSVSTDMYFPLQESYQDENRTITDPFGPPTFSNTFATYSDSIGEVFRSAKKSFAMLIFEERVKHVMFGGLDGVITTFAIVCAGIGLDLTDREILIVSVASLFADAFSMGYGDFVSSKMERNYSVQEYKRNKQRFSFNKMKETDRFAQHLISKGMDPDDAKLISVSFANYEDIFLGELVRLDLDMSDPGSKMDLVCGAFATFMSFIIVGGIPILLFTITDVSQHSKRVKIPVFSSLCAFMLLLLGMVCAHYTKQNRLWRGLETMIYGTFSAAVAYSIAHIANR